jgi:hypothetical protein
MVSQLLVYLQKEIAFNELLQPIFSEAVFIVVGRFSILLLLRFLVLLDGLIQAAIFGGLHQQSDYLGQLAAIVIFSLIEVLHPIKPSRRSQDLIDIMGGLEGDHLHEHDGQRVELNLVGVHFDGVILAHVLHVDLVVVLVPPHRMEAGLAPHPVPIIDGLYL